ncbi:hypothetical protein K1X12_15240 [Hyphomonas sp. WL0036]|uniref:hypothetical protein n=1 Tax=Hyphomonas sediminis TaxID=2866160 RepID=UPI001C7FB9F9|nr:hypothetical protein [Hyphomonas sediminis]MBY9068258.1 hypothetical protein [Hyphomonas sediminis]
MQYETYTHEPREPLASETLTPEEARQASNVGLWRVLAGSMALAIAGVLLVGAIVAG